jgi:hypothetical protein
MSATLYELFGDLKGSALVFGAFVGTGAADPTPRVTNPPGWTVTRTSAGIYRISFAQNYSALICAFGSIGGTTPANVAAHTYVWDDYVAASGNTNAYREVSIYDAANALDDLEATEFFEFTAVFQKTSVRR